VFPTGDYSTIKTAAFLNGASAHTSEFDDIFRDGGLHPGCATIAAALAVAQKYDLSGEAFLRSVIAGYEVSSRISAAMGRDHYRFWHTTATIATFGAAAAACLLLGLSRPPNSARTGNLGNACRWTATGVPVGWNEQTAPRRACCRNRRYGHHRCQQRCHWRA
jgi:3-oxoacyl-[acyl-carrier-protein] synthase III